MKKGVLVLLLLAGCITGQITIPRESGAVSAFFCDQVDCEEVFREVTENASSVMCAMYHPTTEVAGVAIDKGGLVVDGNHEMPGAMKETGPGLMHNKFCVINESVVWTGSWNPNQGKSIANNVIIVESKTLAQAFTSEFSELQSGVFQRGRQGSAKVSFNGNLTEAYFCPEDKCKAQILRVLKSAESSIHVMAYSFTDDEIGKLLESKKAEGLDVRIIFDPRKDDKSSEYTRLKGISRIAKVHHKVFIIDGKTVITGSMNPTRSGDERNDENVVVLRESGIARVFESEFNRLWLT